jgi:hypothetical protein
MIFYLFKIENVDNVINQYYLSKDISYYSNFVINLNNSIISCFNNNYYVLIDDVGFNFNNSFLFNNYVVNNNLNFSWRKNWIIRVDFIENYYNNIKGKYIFIDESFDYYLWLFEYSIFFLSSYDNFLCYGFISHDNFSSVTSYNPLNIKIDVKERDLGEYFKLIFLNESYKNIDLHNFISQISNLYNYNFELVFARVLYPNYYFDYFDDFILNNLNDVKLKKIILRVDEFEYYLKKLYFEFRQICKIKNVDFFY